MTFFKRHRKIFIFVLAIIVCIAVFCIATPWPSRWLTVPLLRSESPRHVDTIVVLGGGGQKGDDPLPMQVKRRVEKATELRNSGFADTIIASGGLHKHSGVLEFDAMRLYAEKIGVPIEAIIEENRSRNTYENAVLSKDVMAKQGLQSAIVVTSDYHSFRACAVFRAQGIDILCVPAAITLSPAERMKAVLREYGAVLYFWVKGYFR